MKFLIIAIFFLSLPGVLHAEEQPIGYLKLPVPKRTGVQTTGTPNPVLVGGKLGEVWYEEEKFSREKLAFDVYSEPSENSEKLVSVQPAGAALQLRCESGPGTFRFSTPEELKRYEEGRTRLYVFEKKNEWMKVQFLNQLPWNGRFAWVKLGPNLGGFVALR